MKLGYREVPQFIRSIDGGSTVRSFLRYDVSVNAEREGSRANSGINSK